MAYSYSFSTTADLAADVLFQGRGMVNAVPADADIQAAVDAAFGSIAGVGTVI